jgi:hypothetical protein
VTDSTWLPNLVGGTSIWKLAVDLNEPKFFDGRLLVPETEGSESLPVTVRWDLTGLVPLAEAQSKYPEDTAAATRDFQACLERVARVFSTPNSGFDKYKEAFTVPALDADGGAHYFYSPEKKKLYVTNWGASPRSMGGKAEYVFGYEDWSKHWGEIAAVGAAGAALASAAATEAAAPAKAEDGEAKDRKKAEEKRERPWWVWPLIGLIIIVLILLALFLLKACEESKIAGAHDAAIVDAATDAAALEAGADASSVEDAGDAGTLGDAGDAGVDASALDAGRDASTDGGLTLIDDDDDEPGGTIVGSSGGSSGGKVIVQVGPGGGAKTSVHRKHYSDQAQAWRITTGTNKVSRTEQRGQRFDVWLMPGQSFEGVRVEWQDKAGKWHPH